MISNKKHHKVKISKKRIVPRKYVPKFLSLSDTKKQIKSLLNKNDRPKIKTFKSKRSGWVKKFENKYKHKITDKKWINNNLLKLEGQKAILKKGMGAYYSSGSRPNQTAESWARARMYSYIMGGPTRKYDKEITKKYNVKFK